MIFVVYMGGSAGDMVTSIIDSLNSEFDLPSRSIKMPRERQQLKKPYTFDSDLSKDKYVELMAKTYKSLPSHDHEYHVRSKHNCIGITVHNFSLAHWAASRFRSIHRPEVWNQVCQACGITDTRQYNRVC